MSTLLRKSASAVFVGLALTFFFAFAGMTAPLLWGLASGAVVVALIPTS